MEHARVIPLPTRSNVDQAWLTYQALVLEALEHPRLTADRLHMQNTTQAYERWRKLFLASEGRA